MADNRNIDELINKLENDFSGTGAMRTPLSRALIMFGGGLLAITLIGAFIGFRMDLEIKIQEPLFLAEIIFILLLGISGAYASAWLSLPDALERKNIIMLPYIVISAGALVLMYELFHHGFHVAHFSFHHCMMDALAMGTVPIVLMIIMMRRGAPTHPVLCAVTNMIAAGALGYLGLRLSCGSDDISHVCVYHVMPFLFFGLVLGLLAQRLYRW